MKLRIYTIIIAFILGITVNITATDYVVISEVLYDTPLNENPSQYPYCFGEFIEIYNAHNVVANLTGWQLVVPRTGQKYTFPDDTQLPSQSFLIVAFGNPYVYEDEEGWTDFHVVYDLDPASTTVLFQEQLMLPNDTCTLLLKDNNGTIKDCVCYGEISGWSTTTANNNNCADINAFLAMRHDVYSIQRTAITFDLTGRASFYPYQWIGRMRQGERDPAYANISPMESSVPLYSNIVSPPTPEVPIRNYIVSVNPTIEMESIPEENGKMQLDNIDAEITIEYFDGLGRPLQTVRKGATPQKKNLITYMEYDDFGRLTKEWLPIAVDFDYMEKNQFFEASELFYPNESRAYTEHIYSKDELSENVLCNELIGVQKPGNDMNNRHVAKKLHANGANTIKHFNVNGGLLQQRGYYAEKTLLYEISTDEDGKTNRTYKDKSGQVVMTRQIDRGINHDTYYVYNDLGQLAYVLPPLAADANGSQDALNKYGYIYKYDDRGNCISKKLPGCDPIYMVYDKADRLVLSQDGNQRSKSKWTVNKYDMLGRALYTSEVTSGGTLSGKVNAFKNWLVIETFSTGEQAHQQEDTGYSKGWYHVAPTKLLTVNYYDDYQFLELPAMASHKAKLTYQAKDDYSKQHSSAKGLLTGTRTYLLDNSGSYTTTAYYYDYRGNIVQERSTNHLGGYDITYHELDFTGKPKRTLKEHNIALNGTLQQVNSELYTYVYDDAGRLTKTTYKLNDQPDVVLADMTVPGSYDELGRLRKKKRHNGLDTEEYDYNIRNWTTRIKAGEFEQKLYYNDNPNGFKYYNGNISRTSWTYGQENRAYTYYYDQLNRYTDGYAYKNGEMLVDYQYTEKFQYDKMGNITQLHRFNIGQQYDLDHLTFTYNGNQISKITDGYTYNISGLKEYQDKADEEVEFFYDKNGNLITDLDREIVTIKYNLLNLPDTIQFKYGNQIINKYDAAGKKLASEYHTLLTPLSVPLVNGEILSSTYTGGVRYSGTSFLDNFEYNYTPHQSVDDHILVRVYNSEGYVLHFSRDENYYAYFCRDHLGSIREVWLAYEQGETIQRTQYYPSGLPWDECMGGLEQPFKYNGKEWIEAHGLDEYYSNARNYYPATVRTTTMDPLCEKYYSISPYAWCGNNPVRLVDPDGRDWVESKDGTVKWRDDVYLQISGNHSYVVGLQKGETYRGKIYRRFENIGDKTYNDVIYNSDKSITSSRKERPDIDGVVTSDEALDWYHYGGGKPLTVDISKFEFKTSNLTVEDFTSRNKKALSVNFFNIFDTHVFSSKILYRPASDKTLSHVYGTIRLCLLDATTGEVRIVTKDNGSFDRYDFGVLAGIVAKTQRSYGNPKPFDFYGIGTGYIKLKK